jgi:hypothetical protein
MVRVSVGSALQALYASQDPARYHLGTATTAAGLADEVACLACDSSIVGGVRLAVEHSIAHGRRRLLRLRVALVAVCVIDLRWATSH